MTEKAFFELPSYVPPLCVTALIFAVVAGVSLFDRFARGRRSHLLPRQQLSIVCGALVGVLLAIYFVAIGLDRADKVASVVAMFLSLAGLTLSFWLARPTRQSPDDAA